MDGRWGDGMPKRSRLVLSALCAFVAVLACVLYARHVRGEAERERAETLRRYGGDMVTLVVANRAMEAGETVAMADVESAEWIASLAPEGALFSLDDVVGREVSVPVAAHAPLCELNFRDVGAVADIPSGHVAVSVPITEKLGVTAAVAVGSHVIAYRAADGATELITQDAMVLSDVGTSGQAFGRQSLTIAVLPADVTAILETSATGDLRLVVPADDVREASASPTRVSEVLPEDDPASRANSSASVGPVDDAELSSDKDPTMGKDSSAAVANDKDDGAHEEAEDGR